MKTRFKYNIKGMTGKLDDLVYYYHPGLQDIIARKFTPASRNPQAERYKAIMANLKLLSPSPGYIRNFKDYLILYNKLPQNREHQAVTWSNLYIKMLFAMAKANPAIDLATLTREQIYDMELPCRSLKDAIEANLLPEVNCYERFTDLV